MITKFKVYESINQDELMSGCYVIVQSSNYKEELRDFIKNNIGYLKKISIYAGDRTRTKQCHVEYENIPHEIIDFFEDNIRIFTSENIKYWSENKEELEKILAANKFNI